jgi:hypothetical protein
MGDILRLHFSAIVNEYLISFHLLVLAVIDPVIDNDIVNVNIDARNINAILCNLK